MNSTRVEGDQKAQGDFARSSYVAARCIHHRGADVLVLAVYAKDGLFEVACEIVRITDGGKIPFIALGDWSCTAEELGRNITFQEMEIEVHLADQGKPTCFSPKAQSTIDFAIMTPWIIPYVDRSARDLTCAMGTTRWA